MLIRIRWNKTPNSGVRRYHNLALALAALLTPAALLAFTICLWSIAMDLRWASNFFVSSGLFSHWEVWLIATGLLWLSAYLLKRYAGREEHFAR